MHARKIVSSASRTQLLCITVRIYAQCISSLAKSASYFSDANNPVQQVKSLSLSLSLQIHELIVPSLIHDLHVRDVKDKLLKQVEMCVQNSVNADNVNILKEHTSLQSNLFQCIKKSALFCLDLASSSGSSHLNLLCLVNMTGVNILFGSTACASKYWEEAFNLNDTVFI